MNTPSDCTSYIAILFIITLLLVLLPSMSMQASFAQNNNTNSSSRIDISVNKTKTISDIKPITIPLQGTSSGGTFKIIVNWTTNDIGKENIFDIKFLDAKSGQEIQNASYYVMLFREARQKQPTDNNQNTTSASVFLLGETIRKNQSDAQQKYTFNEQGSYALRFSSINGTEEDIDFPILVTPEFPLSGLSTLIAAPILGMLAIFIVISKKLGHRV
ncbi:hypothetical protein BH18THE2_BH18THE2_30340 [soil metagenome]